MVIERRRLPSFQLRKSPRIHKGQYTTEINFSLRIINDNLVKDEDKKCAPIAEPVGIAVPFGRRACD